VGAQLVVQHGRREDRDPVAAGHGDVAFGPQGVGLHRDAARVEHLASQRHARGQHVADPVGQHGMDRVVVVADPELTSVEADRRQELAILGAGDHQALGVVQQGSVLEDSPRADVDQVLHVSVRPGQQGSGPVAGQGGVAGLLGVGAGGQELLRAGLP
jgi:hypothetical protein